MLGAQSARSSFPSPSIVAVTGKSASDNLRANTSKAGANEAGPPPPAWDQAQEVASTAQASPARGGAGRSLAGQRGLDATAHPFAPAVAGGREPPRCEGNRHGASPKVHWPAEPVSATWTVPRIPGGDKAKLWCTPEEIKQWRREHGSCADYLSYCT